MRERLPRLAQTRRDSNVVFPANASTKFPYTCNFLTAQRLRKSAFVVALATVVLLWPSLALAQFSPWERAASNLEFTFTGPLARSLALVAIVIGGLMFMFGEGGAKRQISGIVFGGGLALFATQFMTWLF